ncbi:hypothetical protein LTR60_005989, partial [Cryomyces antarcticus]
MLLRQSGLGSAFSASSATLRRQRGPRSLQLSRALTPSRASYSTRPIIAPAARSSVSTPSKHPRGTQWQTNSFFQARPISTTPPPPPRSRLGRIAYRTLFYTGFFVLASGALVLAFFVYDYTTYREDTDTEDLAVSELALNPPRGGPKNLPIANHLVDDDDSPEKKGSKHKPKLVILGTGWGSVALLKQLNPEDYHITVVSPSNHFLFTPLLPSATVGTLELRSLVEPIRRIVSKVRGHFLKASAIDVDFSEKLVECVVTEGDQQRHFYLPYDKLVIGVGSVTNPHGVKGLEYCHFLKDISDARRIRNQI